MEMRVAESLIDILRDIAKDREGQMQCPGAGPEQTKIERQLGHLEHARLVESLGPDTVGITREGYSLLVSLQDKQRADAFWKAIHRGESIRKAVAAMQQLGVSAEV